MLISDKMDFKKLASFPLGVRQNVNLTNNVNYLRYMVLILGWYYHLMLVAESKQSIILCADSRF